jgi:hypothetical protein
VFVKRFATLFAVVLVGLSLCACHRETAANNASTETIAPAQSKPAANETDAMTQTVDIEDSRSEEDGASLNETTTAKVPASATATAAPATTTAAPATTTRPPKPKKQ